MLKLLLLLSMLLFIAPTFAHDTTPECDLTPVQPAFDAATQDMTLDTLVTLKNEIAAAQAACSGLSFSSEEYGQLAVIGPIEIPAGIYRATATTDAYFILHVIIVDGDCDDGSLFNFTEGEGVDGAESVFRSETCSVLLETDNTDEPWTLQFELIR